MPNAQCTNPDERGTRASVTHGRGNAQLSMHNAQIRMSRVRGVRMNSSVRGVMIVKVLERRSADGHCCKILGVGRGKGGHRDSCREDYTRTYVRRQGAEP
jgi:hypothetical protein